MTNFDGYQDIKKITEGHAHIIYGALRLRDKVPVVLKALRSEHPSADMIALMYHEYEVVKGLQDLPCIIRTYDIIDQQNQYALVQEDMQGISLWDYLQQNPIRDLSVFLKLAIQMASTLDHLHRAHIIHKDIKPSNYIIHPKTLLEKLTDFNYASKLLQETQDIAPATTLEGTLAYMAPEQTGRMNMHIDYRSDFYSLGVSFFEMLAGKLPFLYQDPLELLHAHLASPVPEIANPLFPIPSVVTKIIEKLMAKNPQDRYQSAIGLQADLERCQKELENTGKIESFSLGEHDVFDRLNLSQKLYGREAEAKILLETYDRVSGRGAVEALMVCGYSGIGKTMLINEVHKPMVKHNGYFISGKFDQLQRDKPYTAITQALNQLARLILAEPEQRFEAIKKSLLEALGGVAQVIIDLAPDIELIIGPQPPLEKAAPQEARNRMELYFRRFLEVIANHDHPLVIFIDDLQWIDSGSLNLLEKMMTAQDLNHLLLIGAYRDNEVDEYHPLMHFFTELEKRKRKLRYLPLGPLTATDFGALFKDSFNRDEASIQPLADLIHKRTNGNPFFCKQVIDAIYREKLLFFNYEDRQWKWDLESIAALRITDNVVDLMLSKLAELSEETQSLLRYASCVGSRFTIEILLLISGKSADEIGKALWPALQQDFLISPRLGYKRMDAMSQENIAEQLSKQITYQFIHDRVQQAVYQSISPEEKQKTHLNIAKILMEKDPEGSKKERLFEVVDHFNQAHDLLSETEKKEVANLNYQAGVRAQNAVAYQQMFSYLTAALHLMKEGSWNTDYNAMFNLNYHYLLALFLLHKTEEADELTQKLLLRAKTNLDKAHIYRIQSINYNEQNNRAKALDTAFLALKLLGVNLAQAPTQLSVLLKFIPLWWKMRNNNIQASEKALIPLSNPSIILAFDILTESYFLLYEKGLNTFMYAVLAAMDLRRTYGKPRSSGLWITNYAIILLNLFKNADQAFEYWSAAENSYQDIPDKFSSGPAYIFSAHFIAHFHHHFKVSTAYSLQGIRDCRESGNISTGVIGICITSFGLIAEAKSIKKVIESLGVSYKTYLRRGYSDYANVWELVYLVYKKLAMEASDQDERFNELIKWLFEITATHTKAHGMRFLIVYYFFTEAFDQVIDYHFLWYVNEQAVRFEMTTHEIKTLSGLALIKSIPTLQGKKHSRYRKRFLKLMSELKWASDACAENYLHQYLFLKGAQAKLEKKYNDALVAFNQAIENAKKGDFYLWVALGNELMSDLFLEQNQPSIAGNYIREAHYYYELYGMTAKVKLLENRYPSFFMERAEIETNKSISAPSLHASFTSATAITATSASLDFLSVIKASQTISGEIVLEKLFEKMLYIAVENAGAEKALFLERNKDNWNVTAALEVTNGNEKFKTPNIGLKEFQDVPQSVIRYALRSGEPVVLNNAVENSQYRQDSYILRVKPKSVLCLPVLHQDKVLGVIYLENNLTVGAFTQDRVTVLRTLSSQIAISLENARNFERMETLYRSTEKFVPKSFLQLLHKEHVQDVKLGDSVEAIITVLFTDIRDYTTITEKQTPKEAFAFINEYLKSMGPIIRKYQGFINQYQGDAIMALFPRDPEDAMKAVIEMSQALLIYNQKQRELQRPELKVGYGLNTGLAMLGTIGEEERMDANVISDAINLGSRVEALNKVYGTQFLISEATYKDLANKAQYVFRLIDKVRVKGKKQALYLYEVYLNKEIDEKEKKFIADYENAFAFYEKGDFLKAKELFTACQIDKPEDKATALCIERCDQFLKEGAPKNWDGTFTLLSK